ncbi:MAG: ribbon-helix-helix protein, CopG family [Candidatus Udaeobacter sp.]
MSPIYSLVTICLRSILLPVFPHSVDPVVITRDDIAVRTIVDLPQEQIRKLTLFCRREKISRAEAVRRAVERFLRGSSANDLRSFFGASKTRGNISRHVAKLRREWRRRS